MKAHLGSRKTAIPSISTAARIIAGNHAVIPGLDEFAVLHADHRHPGERDRFARRSPWMPVTRQRPASRSPSTRTSWTSILGTGKKSRNWFTERLEGRRSAQLVAVLVRQAVDNAIRGQQLVDRPADPCSTLPRTIDRMSVHDRRPWAPPFRQVPRFGTVQVGHRLFSHAALPMRASHFTLRWPLAAPAEAKTIRSAGSPRGSDVEDHQFMVATRRDTPGLPDWGASAPAGFPQRGTLARRSRSVSYCRSPALSRRRKFGVQAL